MINKMKREKITREKKKIYKYKKGKKKRYTLYKPASEHRKQKK